MHYKSITKSSPLPFLIVLVSPYSFFFSYQSPPRSPRPLAHIPSIFTIYCSCLLLSYAYMNKFVFIRVGVTYRISSGGRRQLGIGRPQMLLGRSPQGRRGSSQRSLSSQPASYSFLHCQTVAAHHVFPYCMAEKKGRPEKRIGCSQQVSDTTNNDLDQGS